MQNQPLPPDPQPLRTTRVRARRTGLVLPGWALGGLVGLFAVATVLAAWLVFTSVRDLVASWSITGGPGIFNPSGPNDPQNDPDGEPDPGVGSGLLPQPWQGQERVTILLLGIDRRAGEAERAYRTDSIMLVSIDPVAKTAALLSIPRDLWVELPNGQMDSINQANYIGDLYEIPGGGPGYAMQTVRHNLGVSVDYYVRMDFTAFTTIIDAIGGIEINNPTDINDQAYPDGSYGFDPFVLPAGRHTLNGYDALRYARTRHDDSDINRAQRQQQVVMAVRDKILSAGSLPALITQAPSIYSTLNESIQTNLTLDQLIALALLAQDIEDQNIRRGVIDFGYVENYITPEGRQVLIPLRDEIRQLRDELFTIDAAIAPSEDFVDPARLQSEAAVIQVLNGSGIQGLAGTTRDWLAAQGIAVIDPGNADRVDYTGAVILDYSGGAKPYTLRWLQRVFNVPTVVSAVNPPDTRIDIQVIVGSEWRVPVGATPTP